MKNATSVSSPITKSKDEKSSDDLSLTLELKESADSNVTSRFESSARPRQYWFSQKTAESKESAGDPLVAKLGIDMGAVSNTSMLEHVTTDVDGSLDPDIVGNTTDNGSSLAGLGNVTKDLGRASKLTTSAASNKPIPGNFLNSLSEETGQRRFMEGSKSASSVALTTSEPADVGNNGVYSGSDSTTRSSPWSAAVSKSHESLKGSSSVDNYFSSMSGYAPSKTGGTSYTMSWHADMHSNKRSSSTRSSPSASTTSASGDYFSSLSRFSSHNARHTDPNTDKKDLSERTVQKWEPAAQRASSVNNHDDNGAIPSLGRPQPAFQLPSQANSLTAPEEASVEVDDGQYSSAKTRDHMAQTVNSVDYLAGLSRSDSSPGSSDTNATDVKAPSIKYRKVDQSIAVSHQSPSPWATAESPGFGRSNTVPLATQSSQKNSYAPGGRRVPPVKESGYLAALSSAHVPSSSAAAESDSVLNHNAPEKKPDIVSDSTLPSVSRSETHQSPSPDRKRSQPQDEMPDDVYDLLDNDVPGLKQTKGQTNETSMREFNDPVADTIASLNTTFIELTSQASNSTATEDYLSNLSRLTASIHQDDAISSALARSREESGGLSDESSPRKIRRSSTARRNVVMVDKAPSLITEESKFHLSGSGERSSVLHVSDLASTVAKWVPFWKPKAPNQQPAALNTFTTPQVSGTSIPESTQVVDESDYKAHWLPFGENIQPWIYEVETAP